MRRWISPSVLGALIIGFFMVIYLLLTPPRITVPSSIAKEWNTIWLENTPTPCTRNSRVWCSGSKEYIGCVLAKRTLGRWVVLKWAPAENMKRLPLASTGECASSFNGMWHIHPAVVDATDETHLQFFRDLSGTDLETLIESGVKISIMTWAPGHFTAAIMWRGRVVYPVPIEISR